MKATQWLWLGCLLCVIGSTGCQKSVPLSARPVLEVYAPASMIGKDSFGEYLAIEFQAICQCELQWQVSSDTGEMLTHIETQAQMGTLKGHVAMSVDQFYYQRLQTILASWGPWHPTEWDQVEPALKLNSDWLPYNQGIMAWMVDRKQWGARPIPRRIQDFLKSDFSGKFVLEDPRSSSVGTFFLMWTLDILGEDAPAFWKKLKRQWFSMTPSWSVAYGLFLNEKTPWVWSYTTSQAYHLFQGDKTDRFQAILVEEPAPTQVEGAVILKSAALSSEKLALAQRFLDFLISEKVQADVLTKNWMLPVRKVPEGGVQGSLLARIPKPKKQWFRPVSQTDLTLQKAVGKWRQL